MKFALRLCLTLAVCASSVTISVTAQDDDPTINSWMINTDGTTGSSPDEDINAIVSQYLADVQKVFYNDTDVYIETFSIPSHPIGPFNDGNPAIPVGEEVHYRFSRTQPDPAFELTSVGLGAIGIFINGVGMYNYSDSESYENKGIWLNNAIHVRASGFDSSFGHPSPNRTTGGGGDGMTPPDGGPGEGGPGDGGPDDGGPGEGGPGDGGPGDGGPGEGGPDDGGPGDGGPDDGGPDDGGPGEGGPGDGGPGDGGPGEGGPGDGGPDDGGPGEGGPGDGGPDDGGPGEGGPGDGGPDDGGPGEGGPGDGGPDDGGPGEGGPDDGGPGDGGPGGPAPNAIFPLTKDTSIRYVAAKIAQEGQSVESAMPAAHRMMHDYEVLHNHVSPSQQQGGGETVTGFYHYHQQPVLMREQIGDDGSKHSPVIGYMFDGFPVYGPYGYDNVDGTGDVVIIQSSYRLRDMTDRSTLSDGTVLSNDEQGPAINEEYPLGYFVQDFEFIEGHGHLDEFNGRFAVTPEYPNGVYAYFATIDDEGNSAFPYLIGPNYYGEPDDDNIRGEIEVPADVTEFQPENAIQEWAQY